MRLFPNSSKENTYKKINWFSLYHKSLSGIIATVRDKEFHWLILDHVLTPVVWVCDHLSEEGTRWGWVVVRSAHENNVFKILSQCANCQFICDISTSMMSFLIHHVIIKYICYNHGSFEGTSQTFPFDYTALT